MHLLHELSVPELLGLNPDGVEVQRERERPLHWRGCVSGVQGLHKVLHVGRGLPELF